MATVGIPTAFNIIKMDAVMDQGTRMTSFGMGHKFHVFDDETSGYLAIATPPVLLKQDPRLTWEGHLNNLNDSVVAGMALDSDGTIDWDAANTPATVTMHYGATTSSNFGFNTTLCFATRLQVTGRPNELVDFTADLAGSVTALETLTAGTPATVYFYPWELAEFSIGTTFVNSSGVDDTLFGFTINYDTGYYPQFAMDTLQYYTAIGERRHGGTVDVTLAQGSDCVTEYGKWAAGNPTSFKFVLTSNKTASPSTVTIETYGFYTAWDYSDMDGLMVANATMTLHYDATNTNMFEITVA